MSQFERLQSDNNLQEIIKTAFNADLDISGSWGYTEELATIVHSCSSTPLEQFEHIFASMRAYVEMHMTQEKEKRYGNINLSETSRERVTKEALTYDRVTYKLTAMKEDIYARFINEYKEGYGKDGFDLSKHFKRREDATLSREVNHWFEVHAVV